MTGAFAACALLSILPWPQLLLGQVAINLDVALVSLDVGVSDSAGRPVTNLKRDDFLIYEDGKRQDLLTFGSAESPNDLILLFDCSDSTAREWPLLNEATARFLTYRKPQDRTMIAAFGAQVQVTRNWNVRKENKLDRMSVCDGTRFYDALKWAIQRLNGVKNRKGVIMLTDGLDNSIPTRMVDIDGRKVTQLVNSERDREFQNLKGSPDW